MSWSKFSELLTKPRQRGYVLLDGISLYVRHSPMVIEGQVCESVLQLAINWQTWKPKRAVGGLLPNCAKSPLFLVRGWIACDALASLAFAFEYCIYNQYEVHKNTQGSRSR